MKNEEMQRAMEFIVQQQAQTTTKIDVLTEAQTRNAEGIQALLAIAQIHEREIETLGHQIGSVSRDVAALSRDIGALGETTKATDERLHALINLVERQISNGRNGK